MNRARRHLTSVLEQISMSERRIPYVKFGKHHMTRTIFKITVKLGYTGLSWLS